jgi:gamma-glutamylcyclotransferase (GGCT)/AIG2-like uncharacterized protein YtfP
MNPIYLFSYGSMKKGFLNDYRLKNEKYIGKAYTKEKYNMYPAPSFQYPYGIEDEKKWQLNGELYELITPNIINEIDKFEGVPEHYYKKEIDVICDNKEYKAYIYFRSPNNPVKIMDLDLPLNEWIKEYDNAGKAMSGLSKQLSKIIKK